MRILPFIALIFFGYSSYGQTPALEQAHEDLEWVKETMGYSEPLKSPHFYHSIDKEKKEAVYLRAQRASIIFADYIQSNEITGDELMILSQKLALSIHFQIKDFSYRDSLPAHYDRSIKVIEKALEYDKKYMKSEWQAELYRTAANLAAPHFYFAYVPKLATEAEDRAFQYLNLAGEAFFTKGDSLQTLQCWRSVGNRSLKHSLQLFELSLATEGEKSLAAADDINHTYHQHYYREVPERGKLEMAARKALWIYNQQPISDYQQDIRIRLYRDIGYHQLHHTKNLDSALFYYQCAQDIEKATEKKLHYTAFFLAAIHLQMKEYDLALKQYDLARKQKKLSKTDRERAWFGVAYTHYLSGKKKTAKSIWNQNIGDQEIMNGISAFYSYFNEDHKPKVKQKALEMVDLVKADNAKRIIEDGWN